MSDAAKPEQTISSTQILAALPDAVLVIDQHYGVVSWNAMAEQISGYSADEMLGKKCPEGLLQNVIRCAPGACHPACFAHLCLNDGQRREMVTYLRHRDGHLVPVHVKLSPVLEDNAVVATVAQFSDMTPRATQEPLVASAPEDGDWVDAVTLLPSITATAAQLRESFERWKLTGERFSAILITVGDAQAIEQHHGSYVKDMLLAALGKTLNGAVRQNDFVGRWMEDQFMALLPHCALKQARYAERRLVALLRRTAISHAGESITAHLHSAVATVRASDTPTKLLERAYDEIKLKRSIKQAASARSVVSFHQQRPM
ncbi:MAG TPA: diguanylate cyclase [Candidatus Acidoferrales bacterium]|nr:diguanylate cyclase [Candidatus Acidoferrales bacterium]